MHGERHERRPKTKETWLSLPPFTPSPGGDLLPPLLAFPLSLGRRICCFSGGGEAPEASLGGCPSARQPSPFTQWGYSLGQGGPSFAVIRCMRPAWRIRLLVRPLGTSVADFKLSRVKKLAPFNWRTFWEREVPL